ncbi:MAG: hypothetical protein ACKOAS_08560 [Verrucomicrobiota bacterium]
MKPADANTHLETRTEIFRIAKRLVPCLDSLGPLTFLGDPVSVPQRRNWIDSVWQPILSPAFQKSCSPGQSGHREWLRLDREIDSHLAGPLAKSSRSAGLHLASHIHAPDGEPQLAKLLHDIRQGTTPGHFAIVFAARASSFHIPATISRAALIFLEMRAAPIDQLWPIVEECVSATPEKILAA